MSATVRPQNAGVARTEAREYMDHLAQIRHFHAEVIEPHRGRPVGCSSEEVTALEQEVGYPLPEAYRQYLFWMGNDYQGIFSGCDWFVGDAIPNTAYLPELHSDNGIKFALPAHYLAFFSHQGYLAAWFTLPKISENPPCYFFSEGGSSAPDEKVNVPVIAGTFTDVLFTDMKGLASCVYKQDMINKGYLSAV